MEENITITKGTSKNKNNGGKIVKMSSKRQQIKQPLLTPDETEESDFDEIDGLASNSWSFHIQQVKVNGKIRNYNQRGVFYLDN